MLYSEVLTKLTYLTKRNDITQLEIGRVIGLDKGAINARAKRNSKIKQYEIELLEAAFNVKLNSVSIINNSLEQKNDTSVLSEAENFGRRLTELQDKHELYDKEMAKLLRISEEDYIDLKLNDAQPDFNVLVRLKQRFEVSIDWLMFGD